MDTNLALHDKLKQLRLQNNYSQNQIAEHLNISRQAVSQWERGIACPDIENITLLCKLYNISIDQLIGNSPDVEHTSKLDHCESHAFSISHETGLLTTDFLCFAVLLTISAQFPFLGIIVPILIRVWQKRHNKKQPFIFILCILCFIFSTYNTYAMISHLLFDIGTPTITPIP